jgi:hypothetical protein
MLVAFDDGWLVWRLLLEVDKCWNAGFSAGLRLVMALESLQSYGWWWIGWRIVRTNERKSRHWPWTDSCILVFPSEFSKVMSSSTFLANDLY